MSQITSKHIYRNFLALIISQYGGLMCNISLSILITRFLSPEDFGLTAQLLFYLIAFNWAFEWGWDQAFMSHKELDLNAAASTHLVIRTSLGIMPFILLSILHVSGYSSLSNQNSKYLILLSLAYFFEKIGLTYKTILERNYKLYKTAILEFFANFIAYSIAVVCAYKGLGVVSLIIQRIVEKSILAIGYFTLSPWKIGKDFSTTILKIYFKSFGLATWLGGVFAITIYDFMPYLIARLSSTYQAGLYEKAFNLATFPMILTGIASKITIPLYTQYQYEKQNIRNVFVRSQSLKLIFIAPLQLMLLLFSSYWIKLILGTKWIPMIPIYQVMTIYGFFRAFFDDVPSLFMYGFKNPWELTKSQILQCLLIIILGPLFIIKLDALGGAIAISIMMSFATIVFWKNIFFQIECSLIEFKKSIKSSPKLFKELINFKQ